MICFNDVLDTQVNCYMFGSFSRIRIHASQWNLDQDKQGTEKIFEKSKSQRGKSIARNVTQKSGLTSARNATKRSRSATRTGESENNSMLAINAALLTPTMLSRNIV